MDGKQNPLKKSNRNLILLALAFIALGLIHFNWTTDKFGTMITIDERPVDVFGLIHNQVNKVTRHCDAVERLQASHAKFQLAQSLIHAYSPPDSRKAQISSVLSLGSWLLVEVEFETLLPAVVIIQDVDTHVAIIPDAVWSGYPQPRQPATFIRKFIIDKLDNPPLILINCFDPISQSFQ